MVNVLVSTVKRYKLLKEIPLFKSVGWYLLQRIARRVSVVEFKKGEIIKREGEPSDALYCLVFGRVQAYSSVANGVRRKTDVEFYRRGMMFGIISFFTNETHSSTYEAINDSTIIKIEKKDFEDILTFMPQLGVELGHSLSVQLRSRMLPTKKNVEHRIVSVYSPIHNTGNSTYAVNLALELEKQTHRKVILVSISSSEKHQFVTNRDATAPYWHRPPIRLKDIIDDYEKLQRSIVRGQLSIDVLNVVFDAGDQILVDSISHFVTTLVADYHFAVVDLPTEKDAVVVKTLIQSDVVHLLTKNQGQDLKAISQLINELTERMKENFNSDFLKVIVTSNESVATVDLLKISQKIDFQVYARFPYIGQEELVTVLTCEALTINLPDGNSPYAMEVRRIARQISGVVVGLALGGGAALGVAHIGVLRVFEQEKIPVDMISGSSMGALIAAFWASGKNSQGIEVIAREFEKFWDIVRLLCDPVMSPAAFIGGKKIVRWLKSHGLEGKTFYDTRIPLKIISYDVLRREELVLESGLLVDAIRQSISIPGVIEPVRMKDRWIIDGGVLNPLPTNVLQQGGAKKIIAVNVLQSPEEVMKGYIQEQRQMVEDDKVSFFSNPKKYLALKLLRFFPRLFSPNVSDIIVRTLQASEYVLALESARIADVVIHPDLSYINWYELYKVDDLIKRGEDAARAALPQIRKMLEE